MIQRHFMASIDKNPLAQLTFNRQQLIDEVTERVLAGMPNDPKLLEEYIADAIFWEKKRLATRTDPIRDAIDSATIKMLSVDFKTVTKNIDLLKPIAEKIVRHHLEEISGHFNKNTYKMATTLVPRGFLWFLRALSWKSFTDLFREKVDLKRNLIIQGNLEQIKKLSERGTVLLAPTHFSNLDSVLLGWALFDIGLPPFAYGAGLNLFANPILGYFMNNLGAYKIDRRKKHILYRDTLKHYSTAIIKRQCHSLFFPGGGRSRSGALESKLKMGILGTGLTSYIENLLAGKTNSNIYIVPCVISYHFVLEASSLIEDYLAEYGKSRYIPNEDDESFRPKIVAQFFYKFFSESSKIYLNFGQALDPFGHLVDDEGNSLNEKGQVIDPSNFVKSKGAICHNRQRDEEYTRILSEKILERYKIENIALTSHFIAYAFFNFIKQKHKELDLFKIVGLSEEETKVNLLDFTPYATAMLLQLHKLYEDRKIYLEPALRSTELTNVLETALRNLGVYHTKRPIKLTQDSYGHQYLSCEDMKLLFYYANRMDGYGLLG